MNFGIIRNILGKLMVIVACLMVLPLIVSLIYQEGINYYIAFLIPIAGLLLIGFLFNIKKPKDNTIVAKEGLIIVAASWLIMSLFGCLPFIISKDIPNFFDAFFEIVSGFTTTGASVVTNVEGLSKSVVFWRSFSHWIGGMGVLIFVLAIIPESKEGSSVHIMRAESPGPTVGKLVSKMRATTRILYLIYLCLSAILLLFLWLGPDKKMDFFSSLIYTFGTAGTGGFAIDSLSLELYLPYSQYVIAIFMILFGINFTAFYLILIGKVKEAFDNEEIKLYFTIIVVAVAILCLSTFKIYNNFEETFRHSLFQVASIISTTGYTSTGYSVIETFGDYSRVVGWPIIAQVVIVMLMFCGACAGSTAGGLKVTRINILFKSIFRKIKSVVNPRKVEVITVDKQVLDNNTVEVVLSYFILYMFLLIACTFIVSLDGYDLVTNFTASLSCISNIGPGLNAVGPYGSFSIFSPLSKFTLSLLMIAGRLELFPLLVLFNPKTWKRYS